VTIARLVPVWGLRLLLALLLLFGAEVLLWTGFMRYDALDWLVRVAGYVALSVLILDLLTRYRVRNIYDVMMVLAIYALLVSVLVTPDVSLQGFPSSLLTRMLGGHGLLGMEMFGLLLVLTAADNRRYRLLMLAVAAWLGFYWGVWMRWTPVLGTLFEEIPLMTMFTVFAAGCGLIVLVFLLLRRPLQRLAPADLRLSTLGWLLLLLVLIVLFLVQALRGLILTDVLPLSIFLLLVCWSVLWFRHDPKEAMLLDQHLPARPLSLTWLLLALLCFGAAFVPGYWLPLVGFSFYNQHWLMEIGFAAVGALWLPLVAVVVAMRGLDRQMRTNSLS
jgi:hypothetical protein